MSTANRDRLNELTSRRGGNVDDTIAYLIEEEWKASCIADWDRFREDNPQGFRDHLSETSKLSSVPEGFDTEPRHDPEDAA